MNKTSETEYCPTQRTRAMVYVLVSACFTLAVSTVMYSMMLLDEVNSMQEETMLLDPEETVLFYQPEEMVSDELLVEAPAKELEYIARMQHLA